VIITTTRFKVLGSPSLLMMARSGLPSPPILEALEAGADLAELREDGREGPSDSVHRSRMGSRNERI
jgi:hypothetical protein